MVLMGVWVFGSVLVACGDSEGDSGIGGKAGTGGASGGSAGATSGGASGAGGSVADAAFDSSGSGGTTLDAALDADPDSGTNDAGDSSPTDAPSEALVCTALACMNDVDCGQGCGPCLVVGTAGYCVGYSKDN
jgi:hypothetical protein